MSDLSDDYSHVGDYELRQELIKWDKLRNRRANKSLKMPPTDIGTRKLPANGKDNGFGPPPENAQLKRNIETKVSTTDSEETEPKENNVPPNEKGNGYYRPPSENAKKNAQLRRDIKKTLGIIDSDEKETEPKDKIYQIFPWIMLFFRVLLMLLSFAVLCCFVALQFRTNTTDINWKSFNNSLPADNEPHLLQPVDPIWLFAKYIAIAVAIVCVSLLLLLIWMISYM